jgi:hypothetical protein
MSRSKKRWHGIRFVAFPCEWFWGLTPGFLELSIPARIVYFCLKSAYIPRTRTNPGNNGQITFSYSALKKGSGYGSQTTIGKAIAELVSRGWIRRSYRGSILTGPNRYEITGKYDPLI